jgi:hypothetical protein
VHSSDDGLGKIGADRLAPVLGDTELFSKQCLRGGSPQRHNNSRLHQTDLLLKPRIACTHLARARLLVQPASSLDDDELEMLDGIGDVHAAAVDPCLFQPGVQQLA